MNELWQPKETYVEFDPECHSISLTCGRKIDFIPYERKYHGLNKEELLLLINTAKKLKWQALDLTNCGLTYLPNELWELEDLKMLYIGNEIHNVHQKKNKIVPQNKHLSIPSKIEKLKKLQVLSLSGSDVVFDTERVLNIDKLIHLDIFDCGFFQIPKALLIPSIEEIGFNCLEEQLSNEIALLINLKSLYLSRSRLAALPDVFGELKKLERIYLFGSQLEFLPNSLKELPNITYFSVEKTPLGERIPPEILNQSAKEIINYILSQQTTSSQDYFNESKMIIVGQGRVGKTCVLNRLINCSYTEEQTTEGIDISKWEFNHGGQPYQLNVWDFGGQEIYHSTHQFFLTKRSLYILVWDALSEDEYGRIDYWLKTIQSFAEESPIIIVVNKCDANIGRYKRLDEAEYKEKFPQIDSIYYVSCKDNIRIKSLRKKVKTLSVKLPLMKTSWFSSWMNIRKTLEQLSKEKNYIQYFEYLEICDNEGIDETEALSIIKYLNDLGIVLYYFDDPLLKHLVILSSEWGTDAVYKILDEQERILKDRNGVLYMDDLPKIWKNRKKYPYEFYPHLLSLMEKFQLAFKLDNKSYLVAELLDNQAINLDWSFSNEETLSFLYKYDFLPAGIMTRFIVLINPLLETIDDKKQCWHKGAYLRYKSAYAIVKLHDNISEKYVEINVSGETSRDKRDLLSKIRTSFERIHNQFSQIKITELIPCVCSEDCKFMFDYNTLIRAEEMGKKTIECHNSLKCVSIKKLLDGVEPSMDYNENFGGQFIISQNISNVGNSSLSNNVPVNLHNAVSNESNVTLNLKNNILNLEGSINDLAEEINGVSDDLKKEVEKIISAFSKIENPQSIDDVKKSGLLNRVKRFLEECYNGNTEMGKIMKGIKCASGILSTIAKCYNEIAEIASLPIFTN